MKTSTNINFTTITDDVDHIKLTETELKTTNFTILDVRIYYSDTKEIVQLSATPTELCGYVEFVTDSSPALSVSWDWNVQHGTIQYVDDPFTNFEICGSDNDISDLLRSLLQHQKSDILLKVASNYH